MHISVDGFTARTNGSMDWIRFDDELMELAHVRTEASDTALYGRKTFELMDSYWPTAAANPKATKHDIEHATWYNQVDRICRIRDHGRPTTRRDNHYKRSGNKPGERFKTKDRKRNNHVRQPGPRRLPP